MVKGAVNAYSIGLDFGGLFAGKVMGPIDQLSLSNY